MTTVYILDKEGKPLMPTTRCGHVRLLLKQKKAVVADINLPTESLAVRLSLTIRARSCSL